MTDMTSFYRPIRLPARPPACPQVWSKLAKAQLENQLVSEAIASYIKAKDPTDYHLVIAAAEAVDNYEELVPYLKVPPACPPAPSPGLSCPAASTAVFLFIFRHITPGFTYFLVSPMYAQAVRPLPFLLLVFLCRLFCRFHLLF